MDSKKLPVPAPKNGWHIIHLKKASPQEKRQVCRISRTEKGRVLATYGGAVYDAGALVSNGARIYPIISLTPELKEALTTVVTMGQEYGLLLQSLDHVGNLEKVVAACKEALAEGELPT